MQTLNWALGSQGAAPAASEGKGPSTEPGDCRTGYCGLVCDSAFVTALGRFGSGLSPGRVSSQLELTQVINTSASLQTATKPRVCQDFLLLFLFM